MDFSYTPVTVKMVVDGCWKECDEFEVEVDRIMADGKVCWSECACRNLKKCLRIKELLQKERMVSDEDNNRNATGRSIDSFK